VRGSRDVFYTNLLKMHLKKKSKIKIKKTVSGELKATSDLILSCLTSLMSGLAALDAKCSSRLGLITVSYYLWTTFVAVVVGIVMVSIIHPGGAAQKEDSEGSSKPIMSSADALLDLIR